MARHYLGVAPPFVINEYGMTELCSQLYDATPFNWPGANAGEERVKIAPPWLKVIARDPVTLRPLAAGADRTAFLLRPRQRGLGVGAANRGFGLYWNRRRRCAFSAGCSAPTRGDALWESSSSSTPAIAAGDRQAPRRRVAVAMSHRSSCVPAAASQVSSSGAPRDCAIKPAICWPGSGLRTRWPRHAAAGASPPLFRVSPRWPRRLPPTGQSQPLLGASLDALLASFTPDRSI